MFHSLQNHKTKVSVKVWSPQQGHVTATEDLDKWDKWKIPKSYFTTTLDQQFVVKASQENVVAATYYLGNFSDLGGKKLFS